MGRQYDVIFVEGGGGGAILFVLVFKGGARTMETIGENNENNISIV